jgi:small subunit ribosomal protein S4
MARLIGSVCKLCRREGMKLFLKGQRCFSEKCAITRRDYPPGQHTRPARRSSEYNSQLREKQKAKRIYGLLDRQFMLTFRRAEKSKGNTGENLLVALERRLDNVVLNLGLAFSRYHSRQLIAHGHIMVNGKKMRIPSYSVRSGDVIEVSKREAIRKITTSAVELNKGQQVPQWLEAEPEKLRGKVLNLPRREDVLHPINEQLIVELCSR